MTSLASSIATLQSGTHLSFDEMAAAIDAIMLGGIAEESIATFLLSLRELGETPDEIAGAAAAMRRHMTPIRGGRIGLLDTCGTGGDGSHTFNISTAAALVTAAAGVPVAKHGNRGITSRSGSADVLAALGVNVEASVPVVERCLNELGICFCFAPQLHPAMKHVAPVRKRLGVPTIFNLLGPLCNPAGAEFQLLGVGKPELRTRLSAALARLGARRAVVVCGDDGLDEVTLGARTNVTLVEHGSQAEFTWRPEEFGLPRAGRETMLIDGAAASAAIIRRILDGEQGPPRDIVILNAAAALWTAEHHPSLTECATRAAHAVDSGAARALLEKLAILSAG